MKKPYGIPAINTKIVNYLIRKGKMSRHDICVDLDVDVIDVDCCELDGLIVPVPPACGGGGTWFAVCG